ncbi:MAG: biotin--[acetyl-CoA-carboxylase] ligase [Muribaculaceae bacterium]|nr:biotin--[acetyl-CoA-carboxylase] ligase [Muribaculaceae bacterium]
MREIVFVQSCGSTNTELASLPEPQSGLTVYCHTQTAGRGQRGNSWEARPGENLTFSTMLMPALLPASRQFEMSMFVSLAIAETLGRHGIEASIKWPNDIYAGGDRKICGILIENSLSGSRLERAVVGVGLNVNQTVFESDAPNPVSMRMLTGKSYPLKPLLEEVVDAILRELAAYEEGSTAADAAKLKARYRARMWRGEAGRLYPFRDTATGERFRASVADVASDGTLSLLDESGKMREYLFKEVEFLLK